MKRPDLDAPTSEWLVYGDALQLAGDPRGELVHLVNAVAEKRAPFNVRDRFVKEHWVELLGECPSNVDAYDFQWLHCTVKHATIRVRPGQRESITPLLAAPAASDLQSIELVAQSEESRIDFAPAMAELAARGPSTLTKFAFVDIRARRAAMLVSRDTSPPDNIMHLGPIAPIIARATDLSLEVADAHQLDFGSFDARGLSAFALRDLRFGEWEGISTMADVFNAARFEKLVRFELRCVEQWVTNVALEVNPYISVYGERRRDGSIGTCEGCDWGALAGLWSTLAACPLEKLALTSAYSIETLLAALRAHAWPSVKLLDLSDGALGDSSVDALIALRARFPNAALAIERVAMTADGARRLGESGWSVKHSQAKSVPTYRYVVGAE